MGWSIGGVVLLLGLMGLTLLRMWLSRRKYRTPENELVNEASANFRPSMDRSDPVCPRCHGAGIDSTLKGFSSTSCPICRGQRHVRFGPEPDQRAS